MFSCYSLRKESVISMYLEKGPCLLSFCSQSQVTLNDAAGCSQAEHGWACSQLMHLQKILHEGSQLLNVFGCDSVIQRGTDASH